MSACSSFTEHVWKPGECKNCFKPKGQHQLSALSRSNPSQPPPPPPPPPPYRGHHAKVITNQKARATTGFRPPVAKKPTIAVKPTMMAVDGAVGPPNHGQARALLPQLTGNQSQVSATVCNDDQANNNNTGAEQSATNNNLVSSSGLTEVLKEIAGLGSTSDHMPTPESTNRETFLCRINQCYRRSIERKPSASCLTGGRHEMADGKRAVRRVALSGEEGAVISRDGGRFCYPEFSSGEESWEEEGENEKGERESWEESDEELLAMEIRMRGQPRFANLQGGSLSPAPGRPGGREKWNTVPLRQKSLQRVCAVDYDDSYDEILNGCDVPEDGNVVALCPSPDPSMTESFSCPPSSSSSSSSGGLFCNGGVLSDKSVEELIEASTESVIQDSGMAQAKPYRVVSLEQPICKPYTVVDVSAAMAGNRLPKANARLKKATATRYQEVWTSSTSPRQKIAKAEMSDPQRKSCHKSAPTSPSTGLSAHTVPVRSPNLSEIKFNSYNNAGMPPFPIIIHDEPEYAHSCKSADKVPILINPGAYDNLAIYRSFVGASGISPSPSEKEKRSTGSIISHTYEEIETPTKGPQKETSTSEVLQEVNGCPRESANRVLSQIVASIQPPRSPPDPVIPESASGEMQHLTELHAEPESPHRTLERPKTLFTSQSDVGTLSFKKSSPVSSSDVSPTVNSSNEPLPPFPPPRSTSSPYHATMLQKHFATRGKPAGTNRPSPTECSTQPRRQADGKPRRWISFKSFFRRKKEGSGHSAGEERGEEGKLVGLDGTVIHMLPPPPVQRHHWFSESHGEPGEKPSIVFMCKPEESNVISSQQDGMVNDNVSNSTLEDKPEQEPISPSGTPQKLLSPDEQVVASTSVHSVGAEMQEQGESGPASDCSSDCSPGGATYSNLGQSRANMIPYKQPRQTQGGSPPQDLMPYPTPPPLPKKNLTPRHATLEKVSGPPLRLANPTYDTERKWETVADGSDDSLERGKTCGGQIAELQADALRRFYARCEDIFMAGQREPVSFGLESWPDFRLISSTPCCQAGDAVYYRASYARDPGNLYAVKICRKKSKQAQREYYHCLAVRQGLSEHFNIQQDCGHFLAEVPARLLPWEDPTVSEEEEEEEEEQEGERVANSTEPKVASSTPQKQPVSGNHGSLGKRRSRVVVITRDPPKQTLAEFVREGEEKHRREPEVYERQVCLLLLQLCGALEHLKAQGITHCDLRLDNLLIASCHSGAIGCSCSAEDQCDSGMLMGTLQKRPVQICPGRLLLTNFSQAKLKNQASWHPHGLGDPSRLAPEIVGATQYRRSDEFQAGILIYEMLHLSNPFQDGGLKEREYAPRDLPSVPRRSPYSRGLGRLAGLLLQHSPSDRLQVGQAKGALRCLIWGPRDEVIQGPGALHNWLEVKRTMLLIKLAEQSLEKMGGVSLEDWLCCQYLAFGTARGLAQTLRLLEHH